MKLHFTPKKSRPKTTQVLDTVHPKFNWKAQKKRKLVGFAVKTMERERLKQGIDFSLLKPGQVFVVDSKTGKVLGIQ